MCGRYAHNSKNRNRPDAFFFFFNDTATTEIYTLSLHDALPIFGFESSVEPANLPDKGTWYRVRMGPYTKVERSEEHTSELQSQSNLVCRLLLEKKKDTLPLPAPRPTQHGEANGYPLVPVSHTVC